MNSAKVQSTNRRQRSEILLTNAVAFNFRSDSISRTNVAIIFPANARKVYITKTMFPHIRLKPAKIYTGELFTEVQKEFEKREEHMLSRLKTTDELIFKDEFGKLNLDYVETNKGEKIDEWVLFVKQEVYEEYLKETFEGKAFKRALKYGVTLEELVKRRIAQLMDALKDMDADDFAQDNGIQTLFNIKNQNVLKEIHKNVLKSGITKFREGIYSLDEIKNTFPGEFGIKYDKLFKDFEIDDEVIAEGASASFTDKAMYLYTAILHYDFGKNIFRAQFLRDRNLLLFNYGRNYATNKLEKFLGKNQQLIDIEATHVFGQRIIKRFDEVSQGNSELVSPQLVNKAKEMFSLTNPKLESYIEVIEEAYAKSVRKRMNAALETDKIGTDQFILFSINKKTIESILAEQSGKLNEAELQVLRMILETEPHPNRLIMVEDKIPVKPRESDHLYTNEFGGVQVTSMHDFGVGHLSRLFPDSKRYVADAFGSWTENIEIALKNINIEDLHRSFANFPLMDTAMLKQAALNPADDLMWQLAGTGLKQAWMEALGITDEHVLRNAKVRFKTGGETTVGNLIIQEMTAYTQMLNRRIELSQLEQFLHDGRIPIADPTRIPEYRANPVFLSVVDAANATADQRRLAVDAEPGAFIELSPDARQMRTDSNGRFQFGFEVFKLDDSGNTIRLATQPFILDEKRMADILANDVYADFVHIVEVYTQRGEYNLMGKSLGFTDDEIIHIEEALELLDRLHRDLREGNDVHQALADLQQSPVWNLMANRFREVQLNLLIRDPPNGLMGLVSNIMRIDGQDVYAPITKVFDASGYYARKHVENLYVNSSRFPYGFDEYNLRFLNPFRLQGNTKNIKGVNPENVLQVIGLEAIDLRQNVDDFAEMFLALQGLAGTTETGKTIAFTSDGMKLVKRNGIKKMPPKIEDMPRLSDELLHLDRLSEIIAASGYYSLPSLSRRGAGLGALGVPYLTPAKEGKTKVDVGDEILREYVLGGKYIAFSPPFYKKSLTKFSEEVGKSTTELRRMPDAEFNLFVWKNLRNDIGDCESCIDLAGGIGIETMKYFGSEYKLVIGKYLAPFADYVTKESYDEMFKLVSESYGPPHVINKGSVILYYFDLIMNNPDKELLLEADPEHLPELIQLFGADIDITEPIKLSDIKLRSPKIESSRPHSIFRHVIMSQIGAIRHYIRMVRNELVFDLSRYLQNVIATLRRAEIVNLSKKDPFLALYFAFQRASRIGEHRAAIAPSGTFVIDSTKGSGTIVPIVVNIGQTTKDEIIETITQTIAEFNDLSNDQKEKIIEFVFSLRHPWFSKIDKYLPQQESNWIVNVIESIIKYLNKII